MYPSEETRLLSASGAGPVPREGSRARWAWAAAVLGASMLAAVGVVAAVSRRTADLPSPPTATVLAPLVSPTPVVLVVDPRAGSDENDGSMASPLKTPHAARDRIRQLRAGGTVGLDEPVTVVLAPGRHELTNTLELGPGDGHTTWTSAKAFYESSGSVAEVELEATLLSGATQLDRGCWEQVAGTSDVFSCAVDAEAAADLRTVRVAGSLEFAGRYPERVPGKEYTSGFLFVDNNTWVNGTTYFTVMHPSSSLPAFMLDQSFESQLLYYPAESWNNVFTTIRRASKAELQALDLAHGTEYWFVMTCPISTDKQCDGDDGKMSAGSRFFVMNHPDCLTETGDWYLDKNASTLYVKGGNDTAWMDEIELPALSTLWSVRGSNFKDGVPGVFAQNISLVGLKFETTSFSDYGFQSGFNIDPSSTGIPSDTAVRADGVLGLTVKGCAFANTGGGGVFVTGASRDVVVTTCTFDKIGQSGVMFVGNRTTQPQHVEVGGCSFADVGRLLASAAPVYGSSVSYAHIHHNTMQRLSRWGITIRSEEHQKATSYDNLIEFNTISHGGLQTKDFGGISFIGSTETPMTGTVVRFNCIKHMIGVYSDPSGTVESPFLNYGVYLDNEASGFHIHSNIIKEAESANVFVHEGGNNTIENNVLAYATNALASGGQFEYRQLSSTARRSMGNVFQRNIVYFRDTPSHTLVYDSSGSKMTTNMCDLNHNMYWCDDRSIRDEFLTNPSLTDHGNWSRWQAHGLDNGSVIMDPLFEDPFAGNWNFKDGSPYAAIGFEPLPDELASSC